MCVLQIVHSISTHFLVFFAIFFLLMTPPPPNTHNHTHNLSHKHHLSSIMHSEYGKEYDFDAPVKLLDKMMHSMAQHKEQQVVVLAQVLANEVSIGYEDIVNTAVKAVNGTEINNLKQLVELVQGCRDKYLRLDLEYNQVGGGAVGRGGVQSRWGGQQVVVVVSVHGMVLFAL